MENWTRDEVENALNTILSDDKFAAAPQMSAFLRCVVTQTLDGNAERIKAYTVAVDALGKPATFDPQNDPSVRVLAKRLRDTLTQYYERTSGHRVVIQLKSGSYIPKFIVNESVESFSQKEQSLQTDAPAMTLIQGTEQSIPNAQVISAPDRFLQRPNKTVGETSAATTNQEEQQKKKHQQIINLELESLTR